MNRPAGAGAHGGCGGHGAAATSERRRLVIGFVASTIYARLPELIREFRKAAEMSNWSWWKPPRWTRSPR
jgi:hypothetical protein